MEGEVQEHEVVATSDLVTEGAEEVVPEESEATVATVATDATPEDKPGADGDVIGRKPKWTSLRTSLLMMRPLIRLL